MKIPRFGNQVRKGWPRVIWRSGPRWKDVRFFDFQSNGAFKLQKGGTFGSACQNLKDAFQYVRCYSAKSERIRTRTSNFSRKSISGCWEDIFCEGFTINSSVLRADFTRYVFFLFWIDVSWFLSTSPVKKSSPTFFPTVFSRNFCLGGGWCRYVWPMWVILVPPGESKQAIWIWRS